MKTKGGIAIFIVSMLFSVNIAFAESTQEMLSACRDIPKAEIPNAKTVRLPQNFNTGMCWGAFAVLENGCMLIVDNKPFLGVCLPTESTRTQLISVFVNYAEKNPQRLHEPFFIIAIDSLREAFKCPKAP
jgi:hypothetical protein